MATQADDELKTGGESDLSGGISDSDVDERFGAIAENEGEGGDESNIPDRIAGLDDKLSDKQAAQAGGLAGGVLDASKHQGKNRFARFSSLAKRNRKGLIGVGVGGGLIAVFATLLPGLAVFKLEHLFKNIEAKRFGILEHMYDTRTEVWMKKYIQIEAEGGEDRYFRTRPTIDPNHPFRSWYHNLRNSRFEQDMAEHQSIIFARDSDNKLVKLTIHGQDEPVGKLLATYDTNKEGRSAIRNAVNAETHSWQFVKRRHTRQWMQKVLGVKKWRIFEGTRDKASLAIRARWSQYILTPVHTHIGSWIECVLSKSSSCPTNTDINQNGIDDPQLGTSDVNNPDDGQKSADKTIQNQENNAKAQGSDLQKAVQEGVDEAQQALTSETSDAAEKAASKAAAETVGLAGKDASAEAKSLIPTNIWEAILGETIGNKFSGTLNAVGILDQVSHANKAISSNAVGQIVAVRNELTYAPAFAALAITVDNLKHGKKVSGEEVNATMKKFDGIENSQGYDDVFNHGVRSSKSEKYAKVTDTKKIHNKHVDAVAKSWNSSSIGIVASAFFAGYDAIRHGPVIGRIFNIINSVTSWVSDKAIQGILGLISTSTGLDINEFIKLLSVKVLGFATGVIADGSEVAGDLFNLLDGGAVVTAAGQAKASGSHALTADQIVSINSEIRSDQQLERGKQSFVQRIASLDSPSSLASRLLMGIPFTREGAARSSFAFIGSLLNPVRTLFGDANRLAWSFSGQAVADDGQNIYDATTYGLTDAELAQDPLSMTAAQCDTQIADFQKAQKSGDINVSDSASSLCLFDRTLSPAGSTFYTNADDGGLGDGGASTEGAGGTATLVSADRPSMNAKVLGWLADGTLQADSPASVKADIGGNRVQDGLVQLIIAMVEQGHFKFRISAMKSDHNQNTSGGNTSNHFYGKAIDIGGDSSDPNIVAMQEWLYKNAASLNLDELIHEPHAAGTTDLKGGKLLNYDAATQAQHYNHIHVAVNGPNAAPTPDSAGCTGSCGSGGIR